MFFLGFFALGDTNKLLFGMFCGILWFYRDMFWCFFLVVYKLIFQNITCVFLGFFVYIHKKHRFVVCFVCLEQSNFCVCYLLCVTGFLSTLWAGSDFRCFVEGKTRPLEQRFWHLDFMWLTS